MIIEYDGVIIENKKQCKILGVHVDNKLELGPHRKKMMSSLNSVVHKLNDFGSIMNHKVLRTMILAFINGRFNHACQYLPAWAPTEYQKIQKLVNRLVADRLSSQMIRMSADTSGDLPENEIRIMKNYAISRRDRPHDRTHKIAQWYLLKQFRLLSINNIHRLNCMLRLGKLMIQKVPRFEYDEIQAHLNQVAERLRRHTTSYRLFAVTRDTRKRAGYYDKTAPYIWFDEFERLPMCIKSTLGSMQFLHLVKQYYSRRCQHKEVGGVRCDGCGALSNSYITLDNSNIITLRDLKRYHSTVEAHSRLNIINETGPLQPLDVITPAAVITRDVAEDIIRRLYGDDRANETSIQSHA